MANFPRYCPVNKQDNNIKEEKKRIQAVEPVVMEKSNNAASANKI